MAKWIIKHDCGHEQTHNLLGPGDDRQRKADWLKTTLCIDCYKAEQQQLRDSAAQQAVIDNAAADMPVLEGAPNQTKWAETIRANIRTQIYGVIANNGSNQDMIDDAKLILKQKAASYWINNRGMSGQQLLKRRADKRIAEALLHN